MLCALCFVFYSNPPSHLVYKVARDEFLGCAFLSSQQLKQAVLQLQAQAQAQPQGQAPPVVLLTLPLQPYDGFTPDENELVNNQVGRGVRYGFLI